MKEERMLHLLGQIDNEYIMEAAPMEKAAGKNVWVSWNAAACLCLIVVTAFAMIHWQAPADESYEDVGEASSWSGGDTNEYDTSPVYYSSLEFADGEMNVEALSLPENADVLPFDESMLSQGGCSMIIEGTVVNLYIKHYEYDVYYDKFDENGVMHLWTDTVVYEIAVNRTWFGEDVSGGTVIVEDTAYFAEPALAVKKGSRYVLPLCEYGETVWTLGHEYAGGDITRESRYGTVDPYHPQIAITNDGAYLIPKDWTTLTAKNARDVIMDTLDEEYSYFQDKMCLVDADTFAIQMLDLVSNIE